MNPVAKDHGAVECKPGLRAVLADELANGVVVSSLTARGGQAVENRGLGMFEIWKRQDSFG